MYSYPSTCEKGLNKRTRSRKQEGTGQELPKAKILKIRAIAPKAEVTGIRQDLVARIRQEIAAGTYETPEKLELALERMLNRLDRD